MPESRFIVRAAFAGETNNGWVWICGPATKNLVSRTVVQIKRAGYWRGIYTEVRTVDSNFLAQYNRPPRIPVDSNLDTIVMAEWYRRALGIHETTKTDHEAGRVDLVVRKACVPGWRSIRAACHHPDPVVRLGTRLGVLGTWLGLISLLDYVVTITGLSVDSRPYAILGFAVLLAAFSIWACWGPPRPNMPSPTQTT